MDLNKLVLKKRNLENIYLKVNNEKNVLLTNMLKLTKKINYLVHDCLNTKQLIIDLVNRFNIKNIFVNRDKNKIFQKIKRTFSKPKNLWIYLSEEQKYSTDSYSRYEKNILREVDKKNSTFITIGKKAKDFVIKNNFNLFKSFDKSDLNYKFIMQISQIIKLLFFEEGYENVYFVLNSNKNYDGHFTLLPINEFDINRLITKNEHIDKEFDNLSNVKFFPNIDEFLDTQIDLFIQSAIYSLIVESSFYKTKVGLVTTNKTLKDLDETISKISKKVTNLKREKEIEEITLLTRTNKKMIINLGASEEE
ncbi:MSC_0622 family F1-like ATPase gamma subunit [Mycoplasma sp. Mirounga ES2805-ORL]|uniref:MSC_0622 family F1-like ATPase gamma subunit n=1 Tax=Mycoplasma sp. Mirounga ES2805-ORL TaxID=754514 RepID=UPI00197CA203|nr:F0F1 ATP synthase subunit gamma [Mycoplasma sp. Mirounga ES2805-ORL]QSF13620.1 F0F1 ATP synthase subunit gamma [Mycoplasma sp. Mirounga ES2805-ORL]